MSRPDALEQELYETVADKQAEVCYPLRNACFGENALAQPK